MAEFQSDGTTCSGGSRERGEGGGAAAPLFGRPLKWGGPLKSSTDGGRPPVFMQQSPSENEKNVQLLGASPPDPHLDPELNFTK